MKICKTFFSQFRGLMFSKKKDLLFVFPKEKNRYIHMFFVFFPIYIIYYNEEKEIVKIKKAHPFTILKPVKSKYIFELTEKPNLNKLNKILKEL